LTDAPTREALAVLQDAFFGVLGCEVVRVLASGPLPTPVVARRLGIGQTTKLRLTLSTLVERGVLEVTEDGYASGTPSSRRSPRPITLDAPERAPPNEQRTNKVDRAHPILAAGAGK
jgi:hypothetical protein